MHGIFSFSILPPQHERQHSRDNTAKDAQPDRNIDPISNDVHLKNYSQQMGNGNGTQEKHDNRHHWFHDQPPFDRKNNVIIPYHDRRENNRVLQTLVRRGIHGKI
jgi:hypothetical protein